MASIIQCSKCGATNDSSIGISCSKCGNPFYLQEWNQSKPITGSSLHKPEPSSSLSRLSQRFLAGKILWWAIGLIICLAFLYKWQLKDQAVEVRQGDLSKRGGTATVRKPFVRQEDDASTSNDESNDQPVGHFGTITLKVFNPRSGRTYTLDAEISDRSVSRIYFPRGGWVDFDQCELDENLEGECADEEGRDWVFKGER